MNLNIYNTSLHFKSKSVVSFYGVAYTHKQKSEVGVSMHGRVCGGGDRVQVDDFPKPM